MTYTAQAWMLIASGGRWAYSEVHSALPTIPGKMLENAMRSMVSSGMVSRFDDGRYGVTHDCTVPRGLTLAEVLRVTGAA